MRRFDVDFWYILGIRKLPRNGTSTFDLCFMFKNRWKYETKIISLFL